MRAPRDLQQFERACVEAARQERPQPNHRAAGLVTLMRRSLALVQKGQLKRVVTLVALISTDLVRHWRGPR